MAHVEPPWGIWMNFWIILRGHNQRLHCRAFIIAWACLSSTRDGQKCQSQLTMLPSKELHYHGGKEDAELTGKQNSKLVSRNRKHFRFRGPWHCSSTLQF